LTEPPPRPRQDETEGEARWQGNEKYHGDAGDDVALLQALLACFDGVSATDGGERSWVTKLGRTLRNLAGSVRGWRTDPGSNGAHRYDQGSADTAPPRCR
jgi:hypothetical protein